MRQALTVQVKDAGKINGARPPELDTASTRQLTTSGSTLSNHSTLELRKSAQDLDEQQADMRRRVDGLSEAAD